MHTDFKELLLAGGPILALLVAVSVYSVAVMWERWSFYKKHLADPAPLIKEIKRYLAAGEHRKAADAARRVKSWAGEILFRTLSFQGTHVERKDYASSLIEWHATALHQRLAVLATVGSISPFVGLFGTVLGVIRAFRDLAAYAGAGPSVVASGIAEALVNTAAGLFVAIPAIVAYNYFVSKAHNFEQEMEWACEEAIACLHNPEKTDAPAYSVPR